MKALFAFVVLAALAGSSWAQQYKWVDENGRVRYGDVPPPGVTAQRLKPVPGGPAPAPEAKKSDKGEKALTPEQAFRKRQEEAQKDREKQAQADQQMQAKRENCARAQEGLRMLESGQRIARTDSKGERYYLDDAQIAQETARARQAVQQWCS